MKKTSISISPDIMGGVPVITGTRIPVSRIIFLLSEGHTLESIHEQYPHVPFTMLEKVIQELMYRIDRAEYDQAVYQV